MEIFGQMAVSWVFLIKSNILKQKLQPWFMCDLKKKKMDPMDVFIESHVTFNI